MLVVTGFYGLFQFFHPSELNEHFEVFAGTGVVVEEFFEPVLFVTYFPGGGGIDDIAGGTGEAFGENDIVHAILEDGVFVFIAHGGFLAGDKSGTNGYAIGSEQECAGYLLTVGDATRGNEDFAGEVFLQGGHEYVHGVGACMATGTGGNGDKTIAACLGGFFGMCQVGYIAEHCSAVAVGGGDDLFGAAQGGNVEGHFGIGADLEVFGIQWVCFLNDEVHAIGALWALLAVEVQAVEHVFQVTFAAVIEGGEGAGDTLLHSGSDHGFVTYQKHGGHDHRVSDGQG